MISVKIFITIYTIIDGKINLLTKNNNLLEVECIDEIETTINKYVKNNINIKNLNLKQCYTFSKKNKENLTFSILFVDILNANNIKQINEYKLIPIEKLDLNDIYINKSLEYLKKQIVLYSTIKKLYPNEFVLPEIQKIYEQLLSKKYDRRNFRKKLINLDIIECLDKNSFNKTGRPAKLYKFKDKTDDVILF